jgi:polyhydroxyalkanoate synthesis regulator phasin
VKERIVGMLERHTELIEDVTRLEGLVEDQKKELEMQHSSRFGGMYDDDGVVVTQSMIDDEEGQVRHLEEKIKGMQEQVCFPFN